MEPNWHKEGCQNPDSAFRGKEQKGHDTFYTVVICPSCGARVFVGGYRPEDEGKSVAELVQEAVDDPVGGLEH